MKLHMMYFWICSVSCLVVVVSALLGRTHVSTVGFWFAWLSFWSFYDTYLEWRESRKEWLEYLEMNGEPPLWGTYEDYQ